MAYKINKGKYNKLLSYRNRYYNLGGDINELPLFYQYADSNDSFIGNPISNIYQGDSATDALVQQNIVPSPPPLQRVDIPKQPNKTLQSLEDMFNSGALNNAATALGSMAGSGIAGGLESGAGSVFSSLGNIASTIPGPWGAIAGAGLNVIGGLTNRMFGSKLNQENINATNSTINRLNNFQSNANSFDTLADIWGSTALGTNFSDSYIGKDGWFSNKAKNKAKQLREKMNLANAFAENSLQNNADNLTETTMNNLEASYAALGGLLNQYANGGGIHIDPRNKGKFNATKERTGKTTEELTHSKNPLTKKRAIFAQNAAKWHHAFGGDLNTAGADFPTGLTFINEGGTHESNPYEGVPMGVAPDGKPNLVEEGEVVYDDYVFSNRLTVPDAVRSKYKLKGNKDLTFADAVKQLSKGVSERPNDPISQETLHEIMSDLAQTQEEVREAQTVINKYSHGGKLGTLYDGKGAGWQVLSMDNKTPNITFGVKGFNPYDSQGNIDWNIMYRNDSPYMKRRQYVIDNWDDPKVQQWLPEYVKEINKYNEGRTGYTPMKVSDITPKVFKDRTFDKSWGAMHAGILNAEDVTLNKANRYFLRGKDAQGNPIVTPLNAIPWEGLNDKGLTFEQAYPNYSFVGKQERPKEGDTIYTDYYYDENKKENKEKEKLDLGTSDERLRYAPVVGLGLASLSDALGLSNNPDYNEASMIEAATRGGSYMPVSWNPIGNKLTYRPFDRDYYTNKLNAESGATRRALANQSGGNSGRAMAGILAADYNAQDKLGDLFRKSEEYNLEQRQKVEDFNRATNQANSQGMLQADMANQQAYNSTRDFNLRGIMAAAEMRQKARLAAEQAKSANLSGLLQALGDIGYENKGMNMIRRLAEAGVIGGMSEGHPMFNLYTTPAKNKSKKNLTKK